jgi:hypothetical protein
MKEGTAAAWMEDTIAFAHKLNPATGHQNSYGTWDQFITHFKEAFNPIDLAGTALHKLHALMQGNDLSEYITTFKQLCNQAEIYSFNAQKDYFICGEGTKTDCGVRNQSLDVRLTTLLVRQNVGSCCA